MRLRIANALLHAVHLLVIALCLAGWAFATTRALHLGLCALTLLSWFVLGPLIGRPGYCFLTGFQHRIWRHFGRTDQANYMSYLFERLTGRPPTPRGSRIIDWATQFVLYTCVTLSLILI
jgi:Protein of Unknown function (DUF2784)